MQEAVIFYYDVSIIMLQESEKEKDNEVVGLCACTYVWKKSEQVFCFFVLKKATRHDTKRMTFCSTTTTVLSAVAVGIVGMVISRTR